MQLVNPKMEMNLRQIESKLEISFSTGNFMIVHFSNKRKETTVQHPNRLVSLKKMTSGDKTGN